MCEGNLQICSMLNYEMYHEGTSIVELLLKTARCKCIYWQSIVSEVTQKLFVLKMHFSCFIIYLFKTVLNVCKKKTIGNM